MSIYLPRNRQAQRLIYLFLLSLLGSITHATPAAAQQTATTDPMPAEILLWPDQHPEPRVSSSPAESQVKGGDGLTRRFNVSVPRLFVYLPDKQKATGAAVIVAPGGGFARLAEMTVPVELHIYETGGHGFGMRHRTPPPGARDWSNRAADWLQLHKFAAAP